MKSAMADLAAIVVAVVALSATTLLKGQDVTPPPTPTPRIPEAKSAGKSADNQVKVFQLKFADAATLANQLQFFVSGNVVADPRTNQLVMSGPKGDLDVAEALIIKLDVAASPQPNANKTPTPIAAPGTPVRRAAGGGGGFGGGGGYSGITVVPGPAANAPWDVTGSGSGNVGVGDGPTATAIPGVVGALWGNNPNGGPATVRYVNPKNPGELEAVQKRAEAEAKEMEQVLKQVQELAKSGKADEKPELVQRIQQLAEMQRNLTEDQYRAAQAAHQELFGKFQQLANPNAVNVPNPFNWQANDPEAAKTKMEIDDLVRSYKTLMAIPGTDDQKKLLDEKRTDLKQRLKTLLETQFESQQKTQIEELKQLHQRLDKLEQEISDRSKNRDSLIDRRLNQILSGGVPARKVVNIRNNGKLAIMGDDAVPGAGVLTIDDGTLTITDGETNPGAGVLTIEGNNVSVAPPAAPAPPTNPVNPSPSDSKLQPVSPSAAEAPSPPSKR